MSIGLMKLGGRTRALLAAAATVLIVGAAIAFELVSGDGQPAGGKEKAGQSQSETKTSTLRASLVGPRDLKGVRKRTVERALLDYWADLQFQDWPRAVLTYDPALRRSVGAAQLSETLRSLAPYYRTVKPELEGVVGSGGSRSVHFLLRDVQGKITPQTVSWRRAGSVWLIRFNSLLDDTLQTYTQRAVQNRIDPAARAPSRKALRAGQAAARLQSNFLQGRPSPPPQTSPSPPPQTSQPTP
jgi:hypothetical protein